MSYSFTSAFYLQSLPGLFALTLIFILWKRRHVDGVLYLILFECSAALWALADGFEHAAVLLETKILFSQFAIFGASTISPFFLLFTLAYFRNENFSSRKAIYFLFFIPAVNIVLSSTNQYHHLVWQKVELISGNGSIYHYGQWFWIYVFYELGIGLIALIVLLNSTIKFHKIYKKQIMYLVSATILPFAACILYIFKLSPLKSDLTPFSFILVGICIAIGIYKQGMLEVLPVARKQIIENLSDGILVIDVHGKIIHVNPAFSGIININQKELVGKPLDIIKSKIFAESYEKNSITETTIVTGNGIRQYEITSNTAIIKQILVGKTFIFHDITKKKSALDSAVESNNLLSKEIKEKEILITDLDAYARSVAHDLKNPIFGLLGIRDMTKEYIKDHKEKEAVELLELVNNQCARMYRIVDELLLLSRIRKEDVLMVPLNMTDILKESFKRLNGLIPLDHSHFEIPDSWPVVYGHPQWIEEVWINLISNAFNFGGNPPEIKIGFDSIADFAYRFWIQDNGNGLPRQSLDRLFQDFERLGVKNKEGHGLGLSVIKRIINKLDGNLYVTSENTPGKGCIFSFTLKSKI